MTKEAMPQLGREVFLVSREGEITRTMVAKVDEQQRWQFLNGNWSVRLHHYSFEGAVTLAEHRIEAREAKLREELRALARKRNELQTSSYRNSVMRAPYRVVDLREVEYSGKLRRPRNLKKIVVPETHLLPGSMAYTVITPKTESVSDVYRPDSYFVLELEVRSVFFTPDGEVHYSFSTPFIVQKFFRTAEEASREFCSRALGNSIRIVSREEERMWLDNQPDDVPF